MDKDILGAFEKLVELVMKREDLSHIFITNYEKEWCDFTQKKISLKVSDVLLRCKIFGISYIYEKTKLVFDFYKNKDENFFLSVSKNILEFIEDDISYFDHVDLRFGREVIILKDQF